MTHPKCKGKYTIDGYFVALNYKGILKKLVYQFKYAPYLTDLQTVFGDLLYEQLIQNELFNKILQHNPIFISIPLSSSRLRKRGYNHAEILAKNLAKRFNIPVQNVLKRTKETKPQYGLKREERVANIKGAFEISHVIASKAKQSNQDVIPAKAGIQEDGSSGPASGMTIKDMLKKEQNLKVKQVLSGIKPGPVVKKTDPNASQTDMPKDIKDNSVFMENLIYKVKPYNHSVAGVLRGCSVKSLDGTQLILETAYAFHREKLAEAKILEILEKVTREITGKQLRVMVELKQ